MQYFAQGMAARRFGLMGPSQLAQVPQDLLETHTCLISSIRD
jgi:hypothetical protein